MSAKGVGSAVIVDLPFVGPEVPVGPFDDDLVVLQIS